MAVLDKRQLILDILEHLDQPASLPDISAGLLKDAQIIIPERTLRRWLVNLVAQGEVHRSGNKRGTKYQKNPANIHQAPDRAYQIRSPDGEYSVPHLKFLDAVPKHRRPLLLAHIRDLWTHTSTAIEGNSLSLGDTHFLLEQGLTIAGKPLRDHQEIIGHARAIELVYDSLYKPLAKEIIFNLHKAVQTEAVSDIYKPNGAWKIEINGTYTRDAENQPVFIEFAPPQDVDVLMCEIIDYINSIDLEKLKLINAPSYYAKVHIGVSQVHPFWDGNGRIARLIANILLLKSGLPPLIIEQSERQEYISILNTYSLQVGQLSKSSGVWPDENALSDFIGFCARCYAKTRELIEAAKE